MLSLGINSGHDSGVCLLDGKQVIFAENEERHSRIKNHVGFPFLALKELLKQFYPADIQIIGIEGEKILPYKKESDFSSVQGTKLEYLLESLHILQIGIGRRWGVRTIQELSKVFQIPQRRALEQSLRKMGLSCPIEYIDHHEAHNASATLVQANGLPITNGIALSMDASGEGWCSKVFAFRNGQLIEVKELRLPSLYSPANLYMHVTKLLGFKPMRHEGKITGLAAYGNPTNVYSILRAEFGFSVKLDQWYNHLGYRGALHKKLKDRLRNQAPEDVAAGVQALVEDSVVSYVQQKIAGRFGASHFFLSGGLFANVKLNQRIAEMSWCTGLDVAPNMGDGGLGLGAAAVARRRLTGRNQGSSNAPIQTSMYLGHEITHQEALAAVDKAGCTYSLISDEPGAIARALAQKKVIAIARGRMEYGPRALCNRSILYHATDRAVNQWLNQQLRRTEFMPFAPVLSKSSAIRLMELSDRVNYETMTVTCRCTPTMQTLYPAVVHVDGTARPQIVSDQESEIGKILLRYRELTGLEVLVNTSFNMHEEPIVRTADESIKAFLQSSLDYLFLPGVMVAAGR